MKPISRNQARRFDELASRLLHIPSIVLMENAGRGAADAICHQIRKRGLETQSLRVAAVCGGGNNGGDGYVVARHLHNRGAQVTVYATRPPAQLTGDAAINARVVQQLDIPLQEWAEPLPDVADRLGPADVIVDALLGTGFTGPLRPRQAQIIAACNAAKHQGAIIAALDVPSGLDCDTGEAAEPTIEADLTITFVATKCGFAKPGAARYLGEVLVADIGAPSSLLERVFNDH